MITNFRLGEPGEYSELTTDLLALAPYFASLPKGEMAIEKTVEYSMKQAHRTLTRDVLSTAIRHHLYDNVLYDTGNDKVHSERISLRERYPVKA